jgi:NAD+ kinase
MGETLAEVIEEGKRRGFDLFPLEDLAALIDWPGPTLEEEVDSLDAMLTLGGDGTMLRAARIAGGRSFPLLGCNLGHLGFLTAGPIERLGEMFDRLASGDYVTESRLSLQVAVYRAEALEHAARNAADESARQPQETYYALNDAVIHKTGFARLITMRVWVDDDEVGQYSADGIVVSTATGSTAYSLSAGGPILVPSLEAIVATPICPHTLAVRPVVVPADSCITVQVGSKSEEVLLTIDGQVGGQVSLGDRIRISRSADAVKIVRLPGDDFFRTLRQKLRWGDVRPTGK